MPDEINLVKISELPAATTPGNQDVLAGVQTGDTKQFSFASVLSWIKAILKPADIGAVPVTRTVNSKALVQDINLTASDVGAVDADDVGVPGGVASLDGSGKVPSSQLPEIPTTASDVSYDNTQSGLTADDVQEAIDALAAGAGSVDMSTIAPVEDSTTATEAHPLGTIFYLNDLLYRALADIPVGGTINTGAGGNAVQTTIASNFSRIVKLTSAEYAQLSAAEIAADIVYIITDDNTIPASGVSYDGSNSGLSATTTQGAIDDLAAEKASESQLAYVESGTTASRAYAVGEYFCWNGLLYRVKTAISSGDGFNVGTNCESDYATGRKITPNMNNNQNDYTVGILSLKAIGGYVIGYAEITPAVSTSGTIIASITNYRPSANKNMVLPNLNGSTLVLQIRAGGDIYAISGTVGRSYTGPIIYPIGQ